jgi:hypothetical protein
MYKLIIKNILLLLLLFELINGKKLKLEKIKYKKLKNKIDE